MEEEEKKKVSIKEGDKQKELSSSSEEEEKDNSSEEGDISSDEEGIKEENFNISQKQKNPNEIKNFSLVQARKELKKKHKLSLFNSGKKIRKNLSFQAFELPPDREVTEDELDDIILSMIDPKEGIPIGKHKHGLLGSEENCFTGEDACKWIQKKFNIKTEEKAVQQAQTLFMNRGVFHSISKKHISFYPKDDVLYRFNVLDQLNSLQLNQSKKYINELDEKAVEISSSLSQLLVELLLKFKKNDNGEVDLDNLKNSREFYYFSLQTSKLQKVNIKEDMTNDEKIVFFLNIYNVLLVHAYIVCGPPQSSLERKNKINQKSYIIGGKEYSVDIIYSILRGKCFEPKYLELQSNPLFHLCCWNGSDMSPPVRSYWIEDFNEKIKHFASEYCDEFITVNTDHDEIWLPSLFRDFQSDFGDEKKILEMLSKINKKHGNYISTYIKTIIVKYKSSTFNKLTFLR